MEREAIDIQETSKTPSLWWKCERCGKLIPYMADFCHDCAYKLFGEPPKPFDPPKARQIRKVRYE